MNFMLECNLAKILRVHIKLKNDIYIGFGIKLLSNFKINKIALREQIMKIRTISGLTVPRIEHKILSLSSISLVLVNIKLKSDLSIGFGVQLGLF